MKPFWPYVTSIGLLLLLLAGAIRLVSVLSTTECGYEFIRLQWRGATVGWLGLGHVSVDSLDPSAQADFWLDKAEQVPRDNRATADVFAGAAWVFDSPGIGFMQTYVKPTQPIPGFPQTGLTLDEPSMKAAAESFESKCRERCLWFARRATELDPADVRWWRMRALLQFDGEDRSPRDNAWLDVLDECLRHDPENALYDYLVALQLWTESADYKMPETLKSEMRLIVKRPELFQQGVDRFEQGQQRPYLAIGEWTFPRMVGARRGIMPPTRS
jgi:hypothetical protein